MLPFIRLLRFRSPPPLSHKSRASEIFPVTQGASSSGAVLLQVSWPARDARWIAAVAGIYMLAVLTATCTLNPYFGQTWDVTTFLQAGRNFFGSADWTALYQQSRIERYWPYAYPPLHALVLAPLLALGGSIPTWLLARIPPLIADVAIGVLLYFLVARRTGQARLGRLGLLVWLFNPVTFYDTAVQGHFEAEWLLLVIVAYLFAERKTSFILPTIALAFAFLFKQVAILFALPYWTTLFLHANGKGARRFFPVTASLGLYAIVVLAFSLPFLLHSGDFLFMNFQYVDQAPLQTQSWLVAVGQILGPESFLLRFSTDLVLLAAAVISVFAAWRGANLYLMGLMITLAFLILSKKVVGYYYVMLLPFALVYLVPARRFDLLAIIVAVTSWISISPYFASWTASEHWWVYAVLGILNTMVWLALFVWLWRGGASIAPTANGSESKMAVLVFMTGGLFSEWVAASIVQPMVNSSTSPIRPPLISPGFEQNALLALLLFVLLVLFSLVLMTASVRRWGGATSIPRRVVALLLAFAPLSFMTFALTKESTTALEWLLRAAGM